MSNLSAAFWPKHTVLLTDFNPKHSDVSSQTKEATDALKKAAELFPHLSRDLHSLRSLSHRPIKPFDPIVALTSMTLHTSLHDIRQHALYRAQKFATHTMVNLQRVTYVAILVLAVATMIFSVVGMKAPSRSLDISSLVISGICLALLSGLLGLVSTGILPTRVGQLSTLTSREELQIYKECKQLASLLETLHFSPDPEKVNLARLFVKDMLLTNIEKDYEEQTGIDSSRSPLLVIHEFINRNYLSLEANSSTQPLTSDFYTSTARLASNGEFDDDLPV